MMYNYSNYNSDDYMSSNANKENYPLPNMASSHSPNLVNSYDGFIRGNMFASLYDPYTPSEPFNLAPVNEREALLNRVRECNFAAIDIGLYLDTHPDDADKIKAFVQCQTQGEQMKNEYERKYGPLTLGSETLSAYPWAWITSPWPWEVI